jgi:uncharacterized protein (TIGR00369 family)
MTARELVELATSRSGYTSAAGTRVVRVEPGLVEMRLEKRPHLLNLGGTFHGGVITGLADHAAGAAVAAALPERRAIVTVDLHASFIAPAAGEAIVARARTLKTGGVICIAAVEIFGDDRGAEKLCALCTVTLRIAELKPSTPRASSQKGKETP